MSNEHPFAQYIRIIGKGPNLSRSLTREEARDATAMILSGAIDPMQLGAFLCILRVRTEEPSEGAGFIDAVRDNLNLPTELPPVDIDWPSYSGKKKHLPYFVLAALALAQSGIRIFMHGGEGHTPGRIYTSEALKALGIETCPDMTSAITHLEQHNFSYTLLNSISEPLQNILDLKPVLGVRTPVNTFSRLINPLNAKSIMISIFHPAYRDTHRETAHLLEQSNMMVFKGEGGEIERRPGKPTLVQSLMNGEHVDEDWPEMDFMNDDPLEGNLDLSALPKIWNGEFESNYATAAIEGTIALALRSLQKVDSPEEAITQAKIVWDSRNKSVIPGAS
ncbi:MAG: glycosyl transferase family protein [Cellvibrionaceae bacterium]